MRSVEVRHVDDTRVQELVARMQHRLGRSSHSRQDLRKFAELFLLAAEEFEEMRAEGRA